MAFPYPEAVFRYFSELSAIPHGSGNTARIRKWALDTARNLSLDAHDDSAGNVIIRKIASKGYEQHSSVILQGHLDMVCAMLPSCSKDMSQEGLDLIWGDEYLSADGTTLGGDDGIAVAYAFALLESQTIPHPPLTVILTADEETGMDGAAGLSPEELDGDCLINLDSEEEGILTVGCAGGIRSHLIFPARQFPCSGTWLKLCISGLTGGHSGTEIHKPLLNANTAMLNLLNAISCPFRLSSWEGGIRDNVIPTECKVIICFPPAYLQTIAEELRIQAEQLRSDYTEETGFRFETEHAAVPERKAVSAADSLSLIQALSALPNGVQEMNPKLNMPETSLNLGIFSLKTDGMHIDALIRSGNNAKKSQLAAALAEKAVKAGGTAAQSGNYPAWEYQPDTKLEQIAVRTFQSLYGKKPVVRTIHAGLECGILSSKNPLLQCISIGPDILDIHTPRERLSVSSAARTWNYLCEMLKEL